RTCNGKAAACTTSIRTAAPTWTTRNAWTNCSCSSSATTRSARRSASGALEPGRSAEVALVGPRLDDLGDLLDGVMQLVVGVVVVRPKPEPGVGAEVAQDLPLSELPVHGFELRRADGHGAAAPGRVARAPDVEAGLVEQ